MAGLAKISWFWGIIILPSLVSCMKYGPRDGDYDIPDPASRAVIIVNEGQFNFGTASLSRYVPGSKEVENEVFVRANGIPLGDVAHSITIRDGKGYIVVNNSSVIFVVDMETMKITGSINGLVSPRCIHFIDDRKAYVTDLYDEALTIIDPSTYSVTGRIPTPGHRSSEQMVRYGATVFTNCWSYDNTILVIDTETDNVTGSVTVGIQPRSIALDRNAKLWVLCDGGYDGSAYGYEEPSLYRIDAATLAVETIFRFRRGDRAARIEMNGDADTLYILNKSVWKMAVDDEQFPIREFIPEGTLFYTMGVDPVTSEIYVGDALDYQQPGMVYRYSAEGELTDSFRAGIIPAAFGFN